MRKSVLLICLFVILPLSVSAQNAPELEFALQLKVTLGETFSIENTQHGRRTVIPITGGTFEGPLLKGTIAVRSWRLSTASRQTMASISTFATAALSPTLLMPTDSPRSTSRQHRSLRHLLTANTAG